MRTPGRPVPFGRRISVSLGQLRGRNPNKHKSRNLRSGGYGGDEAPFAFIWIGRVFEAHLENGARAIEEGHAGVKAHIYKSVGQDCYSRTVSRPAKPILIRNLMPLAGWIVMAVWLSMLALFTLVFIREGGFHQFDPVLEMGVMVLFWLFGWAGGAYVFSLPLTCVTVAGGMVHIRQRWLIRRNDNSFAIDRLPAPIIRQTTDNDGEPYFRLTLTAGGRDVTLREGNDRGSLELLRTQLMAAADFQKP